MRIKRRRFPCCTRNAETPEMKRQAQLYADHWKDIWNGCWRHKRQKRRKHSRIKKVRQMTWCPPDQQLESSATGYTSPGYISNAWAQEWSEFPCNSFSWSALTNEFCIATREEPTSTHIPRLLSNKIRKSIKCVIVCEHKRESSATFRWKGNVRNSIQADSEDDTR